MRIIFFDEILEDENFLNLTKEETHRLLRLISFFANENKEEISLSKIKTMFDISDEFIQKTSFCLSYNKNVAIKKYFKWFSSNKKYIAKSRSKQKENPTETTQEVKVVVEPIVEKKKEDTIDYDRVVKCFNETFKNTTVPQIKAVSDARKKAIKTLYIKSLKYLEEKVDIYEFYEIYFDLIKTDGDAKFNLVKGWNNTSSNTWYQPDFEYLTKEKTFIKLIEKA